MEIKQHSTSKKSLVCSLPPPPRLRRTCQSAVSSSGFTLIELLVAMGILMIIVLMLSNIFQMSTRTWDAGMRQVDVSLEARAAINIIQQDLLRAVASTKAGQQFTANGSTLSFAMYSRTNSGIERVTYSDASGLSREVGSGVPVVLVGSETLTNPVDFSVPSVGGVSGPILPDLVEIAMTLDTSREYSEVRVFVQGRGHHQKSDPIDVIDTHRGN